MTVPSPSQITPEPELCPPQLRLRMLTVDRRSSSPTSPIPISTSPLPLRDGDFEIHECASPENARGERFTDRVRKQRPDALGTMNRLAAHFEQHSSDQQPGSSLGHTLTHP